LGFGSQLEVLQPENIRLNIQKEFKKSNRHDAPSLVCSSMNMIDLIRREAKSSIAKNAEVIECRILFYDFYHR